MLSNLLLLFFLMTIPAYATNLAGYVGVGTVSSLNTVEVSSNIGIGSASPGQALDVQGTARITTITSFPSASLTGNTNYIGSNLGIGSTNPGKTLDVQGTVRMSGFNLSTSPTNNYCLVSDSSGNGTWQSCPGGSGSSQWVGTSGSPIYYIQNVGIGTNQAYDAKLGVQGQTFLSNLGDITLAFDLNGNNFGVCWNTLVDSTLYCGPTTDSTVIPTSSMLTLAFDTGNVGIGTVVPHALFEVGNKKFDVLSGGNVGVGSPNPPEALTIVGNVGIGTLSGSPYVTNTPPSPTALVIGGNVGIGTWKPAANLDMGQGTLRFEEQGSTTKYYTMTSKVVGSPFTDDRLDFDSSGTTNGSRFWFNTPSGTTGLSLAVADSEVFNFSANTTSALFDLYQNLLFKDNSGNYHDIMATNGNFGISIGSTAPTNNLDVAGRVAIGSSYAAVNTAPTNGLIVQGNVGIGTASPGAILSIPSLKATTGTRYLCIDTSGNVSSSASACSGT